MTPFASGLLAAPFLVVGSTVAVLAPWLISSGARLRGGAARDRHRLMLVTAVGSLVHALQRERGLSVAQANGGDGAAVPAQRTQTDAALHALRHCMAAGPALQGHLSGLMEESRARLGTLAEARTALDDNTITATDLLAAYTGIIAALLAFATDLVRLSLRGEVGDLGLAYVNLITAKEYAGQERATVNAALASGRLDGVAAPLRELLNEQAIYLRMVRDLAPAQAAAEVDAVEKDATALHTYRTRVLDGDAAIAPDAWFAAATARIDGLKTVEDRMAAAMLAEAEATDRHARRGMTAGSVAVAASVALVAAGLGVAGRML